MIKTERYPVKPMYVDEAVLQIEMSNRQFVVFLNAKSEKINILYRRKDDGFGLIPSLPSDRHAGRESFVEPALETACRAAIPPESAAFLRSWPHFTLSA